MARARGRRARRWMLFGLASVVAAPLVFLGVYPFVTRWLLSGPTLRKEINLKPEEMLIDWDEAVSKWPGRVSIRNLRIRGSDPNVQWIVTIPQARLRYRLLPLLKRTFRVSELRPESLQFRLRQKVPEEQARSPRLKFLPEIPGFSDPPLRVEGEMLGPPPSNPWRVEVLDVATDVFDDIWVDGFRYRGKAALRGRFGLTPGHRAQIGPASVEFPGGELKLGDTPTLGEVEGRLEATFDEWDVQKVKDDAVWNVVTAKVSLAGPTESVDFLEDALRLGPRARVSGGPGKFSLAGEIDHGQAKGEVQISGKQGKYTRPGLTLIGSAEARLKVASWKLDGGTIDIGGSSLKLTNVSVPGAGGTRGWWGNFEVPSGRLGKGLTGKVSVKCQDGRPLLAFLGEGLPKWTGGLIDLEGLTASADVVLTEPRTAVRGLEATGGKFKIQGEYDRRGENARGAFLIESGILILGVELENNKAIVHPFLARQWFAKARPEFESSPAKGAKGAKGGSKSEE